MPQKRKQNQPSSWLIFLVVSGIRHYPFYINLKSLPPIHRRSLIGSFPTAHSCAYPSQVSDWFLSFPRHSHVDLWLALFPTAQSCAYPSQVSDWFLSFPRHSHVGLWLVLVFSTTQSRRSLIGSCFSHGAFFLFVMDFYSILNQQLDTLIVFPQTAIFSGLNSFLMQ